MQNLHYADSHSNISDYFSVNDYTDSYLRSALKPDMALRTQRALVKYIRNSKIEFDTIVCRGMSGLLIAPAVACRMWKHIIVIRKPDGSHSQHLLEGYTKPNRFIIIDDFICTGDTIKIILQRMHENFHQAKCVAIFCYRQVSSRLGVFNFPGQHELLKIPEYTMVWKDDQFKEFSFYPAVPDCPTIPPMNSVYDYTDREEKQKVD